MGEKVLDKVSIRRLKVVKVKVNDFGTGMYRGL